MLFLKPPLSPGAKHGPSEATRIVVLLLAAAVFVFLIVYFRAQLSIDREHPVHKPIEERAHLSPAPGTLDVTYLDDDAVLDPDVLYAAMIGRHPVPVLGGVAPWLLDELYPQGSITGEEPATAQRFFLKQAAVLAPEYLARCAVDFPEAAGRAEAPIPALWRFNENDGAYARQRSGRAFAFTGRLWSLEMRTLAVPIDEELSVWPEGREGDPAAAAEPARRRVNIDRYWEALVALTDGRSCYKALVATPAVPDGLAPGADVRVLGLYAKPRRMTLPGYLDQQPVVPKFYAARLEEAQVPAPSLEPEALQAALAFVRDEEPFEERSIPAAAHNYLLRAVQGASDEQLAARRRESQVVTDNDLMQDPARYRGAVLQFEGRILATRRKTHFPNEQGIRTFHRVHLSHENLVFTVDIVEEPPPHLDAHSDTVRFTGVFLKRWAYGDDAGRTYRSPLFVARRIELVPEPETARSFDLGLWILMGVVSLIIPTLVIFYRRDRREIEAFQRNFRRARREHRHARGTPAVPGAPRHEPLMPAIAPDEAAAVAGPPAPSPAERALPPATDGTMPPVTDGAPPPAPDAGAAGTPPATDARAAPPDDGHSIP